MTTDPEDPAADPRYDVTEDGKLVPHSPESQEFNLTFEDDE